MGGKSFDRPSKLAGRDRRWPALRLQALRRDGFQCVQCGARQRLEVDHIRPVRDAPELAFELSNLQTLCSSCHTLKTREDLGLKPISKDRLAWKILIRGTVRKYSKIET